MSNFKGTKGKWTFSTEAKKGAYAAHELDFDFGLDQQCNLTLWCNTETPNDEELANALLISKAPEMLEMLEKLALSLEMFNPPSKETALQWSKDINKLIKSATEL